tara:strand:- start:49 stop:579 length:531 start_codon:yes stop_codon:yes gene_type:complete
MIKEPIVVTNILTNKDNEYILSLLMERNFKIGKEANSTRMQSALHKDCKHVGFTHITCDIEENQLLNMNDPLNVYASIVVNKIVETANIKFNFINRIHWNYYLQGQEGIGHVDKNTDNYLSILYNIQTTDGGTEILGKFYKDSEGEAKIFKSNWIHKGFSTKEDKARTSLNIVLHL